MTKPRNDDGGTPFSNWLREQPELDSKKQKLDIQNVDFVVHRYDAGEIMNVEEKRFLKEMSYSQWDTFSRIDRYNSDPLYRGFHLLQFERETPEDGFILLDGLEITPAELKSFLRFEAAPERYQSVFRRYGSLEELNRAIYFAKNSAALKADKASTNASTV